MNQPQGLVEQNLGFVLDELVGQPDVATAFGPGEMSYNDWMALLRELIHDAREWGIAYESIIAGLETKPFVLSGKVAVLLLEVALTLGYKTDRPQDARFDRAQGGIN